MLFMLLNFLLELYKLVLIVYLLLSVLNFPAGRLTVWARKLVEPVLMPVRKFLREKLPEKYLAFDWSVVATYLLINVAQIVLRILL